MSGTSSSASSSSSKKSDEFPDLLEELLHSGIGPKKTVGCVEAFLAFSERGCCTCHRAGIEDTYFICDTPNCAGSKNWYCHSCMVLTTTGKLITYSGGCFCSNCQKKLEFDENSVIECRNLERELVESAFESRGDIHKQSAGGNNKMRSYKAVDAGYKASDALKRSSKKQLLSKLTDIVADDANKMPFPFEWIHYDPTKYLGDLEEVKELKIEIDNQLKDLSAEQLLNEIIRYQKYEYERKPLVEKLIEIVTKDQKEEISFKWTYYDPNKLFEKANKAKYLQKQSIRDQLEDRPFAHLKLEIARYMYAKKHRICDPVDEIVGVTARDAFGNTIFTDEHGNVVTAEEDSRKIKKVSTNKFLYRLPLGPLGKLRSKLDRKTFIEKRAWELQSQMVGSSSSGAGSSSSGGSSSSSSDDSTAMTVLAKITEIEELKSTAATKNKEMEELKSKIAKLETEIENVHEEKVKEKAVDAATITALTKENTKKTKQTKTLEEKVSSLEQEHEGWERKNADLLSEIDQHTSLIRQLQRQLIDSDTRDTTIEAYEKAAKAQETLYVQEKAKVDRMQDELKTFEEKYNEINKKLIAIRNQYTALESKNAGLESKNTALESKNAGLESKNAGLESKNASLESTIDLLKAEMIALKIGSDSPPLLGGGSSSPKYAPPTPRQAYRESELDDRKQGKSSAAAAASMPKKRTALHQQQKRQKRKEKDKQLQQERQQRQREQEEVEDDDDDEVDDDESEESGQEYLSWQEKCAEDSGWTPNHEHVGKRVARYFSCLDNDKERKGIIQFLGRKKTQ